MTVPNNNHAVVCFFFFLFHVLPYAAAQGAPSKPPQVGPDFNPTMAAVMIVLIFIFFFVGFFSVSISRCFQRRFPRENNTDPYAVFLRGANRRSRRASRGLDTSVISTFPAFLYSAVKGLKIGKGSLECAVCLSEFEDDETLRLLPKCSHVFHADCIDTWLASHTTCPVCRANLVPEPGESTSCVVQIFNPSCDAGEPEPSSDNTEEISQREQGRDTEALETNQNRRPRSRSTGWRLAGLFPRSHSTGHSLVQPGGSYERFTLRLPQEVQNQLMNSTLTRSKSCVAFPRVRSSRKGFRSGSGGMGPMGHGRNYPFYERFDRPSRSGHWPFYSRTGSLRSPRAMVGSDDMTCNPSKKLFKFVKSPSDRLPARDDNEGERSFDQLRSGSQV